MCPVPQHLPNPPFSPFIIFSAIWSASFQHLCTQTCIMENLHHYATRFPSRALYRYPRSTCSNTAVWIFHETHTVPDSCSCASCSRDVGLGGTWKSLDRLQCFLVGHPNEQLFHWTRFMGRLPASLRVPHNCPFQPKPKAETSVGPHPPLLISSPVHALHHIQLEPMPAFPASSPAITGQLRSHTREEEVFSADFMY